ncbi:hypothetical protein [Oceanirhabdus sp. W0125-5]|uniref:hypothetical protein n=1 Tax=Oceanirhabdus sp. W0125-5 TaxID=2999116 RepID=UPI0022F2C9CC|nr:hypothetical protein [Oceanirhabdus sp. W0125-5]WBW96559.1 hypothetical protein OW730_23135 [Oceanirhabdus sp. W0125-5]
MSIDKVDKINKIIVGIVLLSNIAAVFFLPDKVGIHMSRGHFDSYVSKYIFLFLTPAVTLIITLYTKMSEKGIYIKGLFANIIIFVVNFLFIYLNLRGMA